MLPIFIVFDTDFVQEDKLLSGQYDPFLHFLKHHDVNIEEVHKFHGNLCFHSLNPIAIALIEYVLFRHFLRLLCYGQRLIGDWGRSWCSRGSGAIACQNDCGVMLIVALLKVQRCYFSIWHPIILFTSTVMVLNTRLATSAFLDSP